ncbi:MAG: cell division protein ZapA [Deltaproteobacteria bacterium]|nr:cell division protein ZapA [Deltaproteobacteria bacterium]
MAGRTVELNLAGRRCKVVTTAGDDELARLVDIVEDKLGAVARPDRRIDEHAILLAAVALAHDVDTERARAAAIGARAKEALAGLLGRVDQALGAGAAPGAVRARSRHVQAEVPSEHSAQLAGRAGYASAGDGGDPE